MRWIVAAALVACLAVPTYASIGNGPQEHPLEKFTTVSKPHFLMRVYQGRLGACILWLTEPPDGEHPEWGSRNVLRQWTDRSIHAMLMAKAAAS